MQKVEQSSRKERTKELKRNFPTNLNLERIKRIHRRGVEYLLKPSLWKCSEETVAKRCIIVGTFKQMADLHMYAQKINRKWDK